MNMRFSTVNAVKANFNDVYSSDDPRKYFKVLGGLDYVIPEVAAPTLLKLAERLISVRGRPITILDVGCSYGLLSATAQLGLSIKQLRDRYERPPIRALDSDRLASFDAKFFASWPRHGDVRFIGLDCSRQAICYARTVGLIEDGVIADLEVETLNKRARAIISGADLIVSTGAVGYITEKTFSRLLDAFPFDKKPWVASFVLRMFDYTKISETLRQHGLQTECLDDSSFIQRRFLDMSERRHVINLIRSRGLDPAGKETEGFYHAELFVSRPAVDIRQAMLCQIVSMTDDNMAGCLPETANNGSEFKGHTPRQPMQSSAG